MDSKDRPEPSVPALPVRTPLAQSATPEASPLKIATADASGTVDLIGTTWRAITRHWWKLLALWAVVSAGLIYLIAVRVKPSYETFSMLRVEPTHRELFLNLHSAEAFDHFLETQVQLVTSPNVLVAALADPRVAGLSMLCSTTDAEAELRRLVQVGVMPRTYLIKVAVTSPTPAEAAVIINAVVKGYLLTASEWSDGMTRNQLKSLETYQQELQQQVVEKQKAWLELANKGSVELVNSDEGSEQSPGSGLPRPTNNRITLAEYKRVRGQLFDVSIELVETEALLNTQQAELKAAAPGMDPALRLQRRVREAFRADPEVVQVYQQIEKARRRLDDAADRTVRERPRAGPGTEAVAYAGGAAPATLGREARGSDRAVAGVG